jgi:hypothetical protein
MKNLLLSLEHTNLGTICQAIKITNTWALSERSALGRKPREMGTALPNPVK